VLVTGKVIEREPPSDKVGEEIVADPYEKVVYERPWPKGKRGAIPTRS
jgi:hypothetical protein